MLTLSMFVKANLISILLVLVALILLVWLYRHGKKDLVKRIILNLVVFAEQRLGSGTGELKYNMVVSMLYERLPLLLRMIFTKKDIDKYIEEAVHKLKDYLSEGDVNLLSYAKEQELKYKGGSFDSVETIRK